MQNKILITLLAIVLCTACKKNTTTEEPKKVYTPTQTGQNILYCKINGEERIFEGKGSPVSNDDGVYIFTPPFPDSNGKLIRIYADNTAKYDENILLYIDLPSDQILLNSPQLNNPFKIVTRFPNDKSFYIKSDKIHTIDSLVSNVTFTRFDDVVASGTFYFEAYSGSGDKVTATEGFFDIVREK